MALHGRDADVALLDETLVAARAGRGRAVFFTGEAGIGKSTLIAEARARAAGAAVLAGAAWESGGAPPYWPWQQVLRDAAEQLGTRAATLPLVGNWAPSDSATDPAAARFALLDAVTRALVTIATEKPLVIVLDDLHAADLPTLDLLVHLVRELPRAAIALVAAWREGELAVRKDAAQRLARASRHGTVRPLRRLTADEVARWVGNDAAAIHATSEGNPLFVEELLRTRQGGVQRAGIAHVLDDHLALLSEGSRELLAVASVLGREFDEPLVARLAAQPLDHVAAALRDAASVGVVERRSDAWAFRHVLLRDHLYDALAPSRRAELHQRAGELLTDPVRAARHLLAGLTDDGIERAVAAARVAAARAAAVYAFEEAAELLEAALRALERTRGPEHTDVMDLRLELARAFHDVGSSDRARAECVRLGETAQARGDAGRLARAALVYAAELRTGRRDAVMEQLLERARAALPAGDSTLRARVTARLAAAMIPTNDAATAAHAHALADEAVAMARRLSDDETLMYALRFAAHAYNYQIAARAALDGATEVTAIADRLGHQLEAVDHITFLFSGNIAIGARAAADAAADRVLAMLERLPQPHYRWRIPILRATRAILDGRFEDAERLHTIAETIAREYELDRAGFAVTFGRLGAISVSRDRERAAALVDAMRALIAQTGGYTSGVLAYVLAMAGRTDEARTLLGTHNFVPALIVLQFAVEAVLVLGDRALAEQAVPVMAAQTALNPMVIGHAACCIARPAATVLGELYALCGRTAEAIASCEQGLALARALQSPPLVALAEQALARVRCPAPVEPTRAATLALRDGSLCWNGRTFALSTAKGFEYLATLVASPHHEVHVSDLVGDEDRGDAGEVLDAKARTQYRERAEELAEELEQARSRNDLGRAERLAAELEAISDELLAATGLGGRSRKAGSRVERARVNVQRRLKDAIRRLAQEDADLGRYLEATIRTGTFCSYVPL